MCESLWFLVSENTRRNLFNGVRFDIDRLLPGPRVFTSVGTCTDVSLEVTNQIVCIRHPSLLHPRLFCLSKRSEYVYSDKSSRV